jgi:CRP-like cAMP-binding protein
MHAREAYEQLDLLSGFAMWGEKDRLRRLLRLFIANGYAKSVREGFLLTLPLQRQELAQMLGTTPAQLSRLLTGCEKEGAIHRDRGWLLIPHKSTLLV